MSDESWRTLVGADQTSEEFPRLAMKILDAQRQTTLDVLQFAEDDVTQLIEIIDRKVRDPSRRAYLMRGLTICRSYNMRLFRVI